MIAKIIPILRLPGNLQSFDYLIDEQKITVGQIVDIPFRNRKALGIVEEITDKKSNFKLKKINKVLPYQLTSEQLTLLKKINGLFGLSSPYTLKVLMPELPLSIHKHKLPDVTDYHIELNEKAITNKLNSGFIQFNSQQLRFGFISSTIKQAKGQVLIITPDKQSAKVIYYLANKNYNKKQVALIDANISKSLTGYYWENIQNGNIKIIIGTRKTLFYPFYNLEKIIVDQSSSPHHKQWDQSPRYNSLTVMQIMMKIYNAKLFFLDCLPSFYIFNLLSEKKLSYYRLLDQSTSNLKFIYDNKKNIIEDINSHLNKNKKTIIITNQKKDKVGLTCIECGYYFRCQKCNRPLTIKHGKLLCQFCNQSQSSPSHCPQCHSPHLSEYNNINTELKNKLDESKLKYSNFDSETKHVPDNKIIFATNAILPYLSTINPDKIIIPSIESFMHPLDVDTKWQISYLFQYLRTLTCPIYLYAYRHSDKLIDSILAMPKNIGQELKILDNLKLPPKHKLLKIIIKNAKQNKAIEQSQKIYNDLKKEVINKQKVSSPYQSSQIKQNNKYVYFITVTDVTDKELAKIIKKDYDMSTFDINPNKIFS